MDLLEELRAARAQTAATLATLDTVVERVSRLQAALAPEGPSNGKANGHRAPSSASAPAPAPALSAADTTRGKILAALGDWTRVPVLIEALNGHASPSAVHSMVGYLVRDRLVERRGKGKRHEYRRVDGAVDSPRRRHGATRAQIRAAAKDWVTAGKLHHALTKAGLTHGQIQSGIMRMVENKELAFRGKAGQREYQARS